MNYFSSLSTVENPNPRKNNLATQFQFEISKSHSIADIIKYHTT